MWQDDWDRARQCLTAWWRHEGPAVSVMAPKDTPWADVAPPPYYLPFCQPNAPRPPGLAGGATIVPAPASRAQVWTDPQLRFDAAVYAMAHTFYGGAAFPYFDTHLGPCTLAAFAGATPTFEDNSVWFEPCLASFADAAPLRFNEDNPWWQRQMAIIRHGVAQAHGRFLVSVPDMIENVDILAALRGTTSILMDMALEPAAVLQRVRELNALYREAFARMHALLCDEQGGNCVSVFDIWAPGKTAKIQCDLATMISPVMFNELVRPGLEEQCQQFDFVLFHLDGSQALQHLDALLAMDCIDAIEWTPEPGAPWGGAPQWYELYRRILAAGKSVQAVFVKPEEIAPLFNAVGRAGMFVMTRTASETAARRLLDQVCC
jgi:hypothetical protein